MAIPAPARVTFVADAAERVASVATTPPLPVNLHTVACYATSRTTAVHSAISFSAAAHDPGLVLMVDTYSDTDGGSRSSRRRRAPSLTSLTACKPAEVRTRALGGVPVDHPFVSSRIRHRKSARAAARPRPHEATLALLSADPTARVSALDLSEWLALVAPPATPTAFGEVMHDGGDPAARARVRAVVDVSEEAEARVLASLRSAPRRPNPPPRPTGAWPADSQASAAKRLAALPRSLRTAVLRCTALGTLAAIDAAVRGTPPGGVVGVASAYHRLLAHAAAAWHARPSSSVSAPPDSDAPAGVRLGAPRAGALAAPCGLADAVAATRTRPAPEPRRRRGKGCGVMAAVVAAAAMAGDGSCSSDESTSSSSSSGASASALAAAAGLAMAMRRVGGGGGFAEVEVEQVMM